MKKDQIQQYYETENEGNEIENNENNENDLIYANKILKTEEDEDINYKEK